MQKSPVFTGLFRQAGAIDNRPYRREWEIVWNLKSRTSHFICQKDLLTVGASITLILGIIFFFNKKYRNEKIPVIGGSAKEVLIISVVAIVIGGVSYYIIANLL